MGSILGLSCVHSAIDVMSLHIDTYKDIYMQQCGFRELMVYIKTQRECWWTVWAVYSTYIYISREKMWNWLEVEWRKTSFTWFPRRSLDKIYEAFFCMWVYGFIGDQPDAKDTLGWMEKSYEYSHSKLDVSLCDEVPCLRSDGFLLGESSCAPLSRREATLSGRLSNSISLGSQYVRLVWADVYMMVDVWFVGRRATRVVCD